MFDVPLFEALHYLLCQQHGWVGVHCHRLVNLVLTCIYKGLGLMTSGCIVDQNTDVYVSQFFSVESLEIFWL